MNKKNTPDPLTIEAYIMAKIFFTSLLAVGIALILLCLFLQHWLGAGISVMVTLSFGWIARMFQTRVNKSGYYNSPHY